MKYPQMDYANVVVAEKDVLKSNVHLSLGIVPLHRLLKTQTSVWMAT